MSHQPFEPAINPDHSPISGGGYLGTISKAGQWLLETHASDMAEWRSLVEDDEVERRLIRGWWEARKPLSEIWELVNLPRALGGLPEWPKDKILLIAMESL